MTNVTWHRTAVTIAAWIEIIVGASFVLVPNTQSEFIFGATAEGVSVVFARFVGIGLIGLGIACLPANPNAVRGLFVFNLGVTIFFAYLAVATPFRGVMLWPVVILHAVLTIALALSLKLPDVERSSVRYTPQLE